MTPDAPPRAEPYQAQHAARMTVRGRALGVLHEHTVIIRATEDGDVHPDGTPIVLRDRRPSVPPASNWLVLWAPERPPVLDPVAEISPEEALRACAAWTAVPRASCVAHALAREVARLRAQLANGQGGRHSGDRHG